MIARPAFGRYQNQLCARPAAQPVVTLNAEALAVGDPQKRLARRTPRARGAMEALGDALGAAMPSSTSGKVATGVAVLALTGWLLSVSAKTRR